MIYSYKKTSTLFLISIIYAFIVINEADTNAKEKAIIQLSGNVAATSPKNITVHDLEKLPLTKYTTFNPYEKKDIIYTGVTLKTLIKTYAAPNTTKLIIKAIDNFEVEFEKAEWERWDILLATQSNGKHISISESGPAKIVLPYNTAKDIDREVYNLKWIWLINRIIFSKDKN